MKKKYLELKESIRMMDSQRSDTEKINLIKEGKKEALLKPLNRMILLKTVLSLKNKIMSSYCLKCRKNTESINPRVCKANNGKSVILPKCAKDLLKNKKQK